MLARLRPGIAHALLPLVLATALVLVVMPAFAQTRPANVVVAENGNWAPAAGYTWINPDAPNDYRVKWTPGTVHREHPNVVAGDQEGNFLPAPGYTWVDAAAPGDLRVVRIGSTTQATANSAGASATVPPRVNIVSTASLDSRHGRVAAAFVEGWGASASLRTAPTGTATPFAQAIREMLAGPADGSVLLSTVVSVTTSKAVLTAFARFQPIALLAQQSSTGYIVLLAPPATPASRVQALRARAEQIVSSADHRARVNTAGAIVPAAAVTEGVLRRLQAAENPLEAVFLSPPAPATVVSNRAGGGATTNTASAGGGSVWPLGIAPGNLYIIGVCPAGTTGVCRQEMQLVSGQSPQEALAVAETARPFHYRFQPGTRFVVAKECTGPNWGAVVFHSETVDGPFAWGADCGHPTPAAAMRVAGEACRQVNGGRPCGGRQWFKMFIGHSGERRAEFNNSDQWWMTAQLWAMGPPTNFTPQLLASVEDGIAKLGRLCTSPMNAASYACFITFRKYFDCGTHTPACLDPRFTARGVEP